MKANIVVKTQTIKTLTGKTTKYRFLTLEKYNSEEELLKIIDKEIEEVEDDVWNLNRVYRVLTAKRKDLVELKELRKLVVRDIEQNKSSETPKSDD